MDLANSLLPAAAGHPNYAFSDSSRRYSGSSKLGFSEHQLECNAGLPLGEVLAIDDLLDFSNEEIGGPIGEVWQTSAAGSSTTTTTSNSDSQRKLSSCGSLQLKSNADHQPVSVFDSDGPGGLCIPACDDFAELEWLSHFVEESFSSRGVATDMLGSGSNTTTAGFEDTTAVTGNGNKHHISGILAGCKKLDFHSASPISVLESTNASSGAHAPRSISTIEAAAAGTCSIVPGRARSKRSRSGVCFWNSRILSAVESYPLIETCSSTSTDVTAVYHDDSDGFLYSERPAASTLTLVGDSPAAVKKKKVARNSSSKGAIMSSKLHIKADEPTQVINFEGGAVRKCLHCGTQKTPQWRAGPMGPKTLCNACGVRFKSGRLLPEYRPAASPTFVETAHSNSHRRVLEMRRQKGCSETPPYETHRPLATHAARSQLRTPNVESHLSHYKGDHEEQYSLIRYGDNIKKQKKDSEYQKPLHDEKHPRPHEHAADDKHLIQLLEENHNSTEDSTHAQVAITCTMGSFRDSSLQHTHPEELIAL